jgi:antitoxin VapB
MVEAAGNFGGGGFGYGDCFESDFCLMEEYGVYTIHIYGGVMATAKVFQSGNSQAIRLPKEFRFRSKEVEITRRGNEVVLREKPRNLGELVDLLRQLPDEMFEDIHDTRLPEEREGL